jgi:putative endonuclease
MATPSANALGRVGEEIVARYLDRKGLHVLDRNWRCEEGEIDIVALSDATLVDWPRAWASARSDR